MQSFKKKGIYDALFFTLCFLLLLFLISCASPVKKTEGEPIVKNNLGELKEKCEEKGDAISCARYGYLTKELTYTRYACNLGHQNSCFNVQEIENRAPNQNFAIINAHQGQIYGCYVNNSIDEDMGEGVKRDKEIELVFVIGLNGEINGLSIIGQKISQKFKECVISSFTAKKFIGTEHNQSIRYTFAMPEVATDKRLKGKRKTIFD